MTISQKTRAISILLLFFVVFIIHAALLRRHELHIAKILKIFQKNIFLNIFKQNKKNEGKFQTRHKNNGFCSSDFCLAKSKSLHEEICANCCLLVIKVVNVDNKIFAKLIMNVFNL
jgi:hypothetical protein